MLAASENANISVPGTDRTTLLDFLLWKQMKFALPESSSINITRKIWEDRYSVLAKELSVNKTILRLSRSSW